MEDSTKRYLEAAHGMQTAVAMLMEHDPGETSPKHLRVGVNAAIVDVAALAKLLVTKGLITDDEYCVSVAEMMEAERDRYQQLVREKLGAESVFLH